MLGPITPPIWIKIQSKIDKKYVLKAPSKKTLKKTLFKVENRPFEIEKGSFCWCTVVLNHTFRISAKSRKNEHRNHHFGKVSGTKMNPRLIKTCFKIVITTKPVFAHFRLTISVSFWSPRWPPNPQTKLHFLIVQFLGTLLAPKASPNPSKTAQRVRF